MRLKAFYRDNNNSVNILEDFTDDNGKLIEQNIFQIMNMKNLKIQYIIIIYQKKWVQIIQIK